MSAVAVALPCQVPFFLAEAAEDVLSPRMLPYESLLLASPSLISDSAAPAKRSRAIPLDVILDYKVEYTSGVLDFARKRISQDEDEESFFIINLDALRTQYEQWGRLLPRVEPFYAMKCNPNPAFLRVLASLGAGFDCASKEEIRMARETGVPSAKLIYANPCKAPLHIKKAKQEGVKMMTFDNVDELRKIHQYYPEAELVLRILPDDSHSLMKFGSKFGAASDSWETLYAEAKRLQLNVIGVSFHVGSGCFDAIAYEHALKLARSAFDLADRYGFEMTLLDIGGGFPGSSHNVSVTFPEIAAVLRPLLDELFPDSVRVIAEPGRYFAEPTMTFVSRIHSKRTYIEEGARAFKYYIHDGVYGAFNCIMFDHAKPEAHLVFPSVNHLNQAEYKSTVFGPTCDSIDKIVFGQMLPELEVGQWLFFPNMGAYTTAAASTFNGFQPPQQFYVISELQHKKICIDDTGLS